MRTHYAFDDRRFLEPNQADAAGYARFLESQLDDEASIVFVAEQRQRIDQFRALIARARSEGQVSAAMLGQIASQARILLGR